MRMYFYILRVLIENGLTDAALPGLLSQRWLALLLPPLLPVLLVSLALRVQLNAVLALLVGAAATLAGWSPAGGSPWWTHLLAAFAALNALLVILWPARVVELETENGRAIRLATLPMLIPITGR